MSLTGHDVLHLPYLEGNCLACHEDHRSTAKGLLKPDGNRVCLACHTGLETVPGGRDLVHPPKAGACIDCHNPHQSPVRNLIRSDEQLLACAQCHKDFLEAAARLPYRHQFFAPQGRCGQCHYAHQKSANKYLRPDVGQSCLTCHDLPIQTTGLAIGNIAGRLRTEPVVHGAIKQGSCPACHTPHGSDQPSLLLSGYPAGNYDVYRTDQYALCWKCHSNAIVESPAQAAKTGFRTDTLNLHHVHVAQLKRGRACHLCHEAHAASQPHLMRRAVPYGRWMSPLEWSPLPDGGRCLTPCHKEREYRHGKP